MTKIFPSSTHFHAFWMCHLCGCSSPTVFAPHSGRLRQAPVPESGCSGVPRTPQL